MVETRLVSVADLVRQHPAFTDASIRWLLFKADENGLSRSGAVCRVGRRVLIDEPKFIEWIKSSPARTA